MCLAMPCSFTRVKLKPCLRLAWITQFRGAKAAERVRIASWICREVFIVLSFQIGNGPMTVEIVKSSGCDLRMQKTYDRNMAALET